MYTRTTTIIERSDVSHVLFYRWKDGTNIVTFVANHPSTASNTSTDCEPIYTFTGKYSGVEDVEGKLYKYTKSGDMILIGHSSMHGSVMKEILSVWDNHIKEIEKNA